MRHEGIISRVPYIVNFCNPFMFLSCPSAQAVAAVIARTETFPRLRRFVRGDVNLHADKVLGGFMADGGR
jgi:hypothetical protein